MLLPAKSLIRLKLVNPFLRIPANSSVTIPLLNSNPITNDTSHEQLVIPVTPSHYIRWFSMLPDMVVGDIFNEAGMMIDINEPEISYTDGGFNEMFLDYRVSFLAIQNWLLRKHDNIIHQSLYEKPFVDFEPVAEASLALLKLIQKIYDKQYLRDTKKILSQFKLSDKEGYYYGYEPMIWFSCEYCTLKTVFETNGMFGKALLKTQQTVDKSIKDYDSIMRNAQQTSSQISNFPANLNDLKTAYNDGYLVIRTLAEELSKVNSGFYNEIFLPYCEIRKRTLRQLRRNTDMQLVYLNEYGEYIRQTQGRTKKRQNNP